MDTYSAVTDIELNAIPTANDAIATNDKQDTPPEDVYKYKKISVFIPKLITTIEQLERLDQDTRMNLDLTKSRKRLASLVIDNTNPNEEDIKEFIDVLSSALYGLSDGMRLMAVEQMIQEKKSRALDLLADISLIQEDIVKLAS